VYLTAQWVRARDVTLHLNAVLYEHEGTDAPPDLWKRERDEILRLVTTTHPGKRVAARLETIPGGNSVESFLDVVAPDGASLRAVARTIDALRDTLLRTRAPREHVSLDDVVAEFGSILGEAEPIRRFDELRDAALELYRDRLPPWQSRDPLTIVQERDEDGLQFRLDPASVARLEEQGPKAAREHRTVRVPFDVKDEFEPVHGSLYAHVGQWLTGLSREELLHWGGVRFVEDGKEVTIWPARD
jgi:hypothetical protein